MSGEHLHDMRFPSETEHSRGAPDELLRAEKDPRDRTEEAARRQLPSGGVVPTDYASRNRPSTALTA